MNFADSKRGVGDLVDSTYEAALSDLEPRRFPRNALPCRFLGHGAGTGEYFPGGALEFDVPRREESKRYVTKVRDYWRTQGYDSVRVDPVGETVYAQTTDRYRMSFNVTPDVGRALLGASGPCAEPESEEEREAPPRFRSLGES